VRNNVCARLPRILLAVSTCAFVESVLGGIAYREDSFMGRGSTSRTSDPKAVPARRIVLSPWINEAYPALTELLSAQDVARLTRRPRWLLVGMTLIGRFPPRARFRGKAVGWWRSEVLEWMARDRVLERHCMTSARACSRKPPRQTRLPLESGGHRRAVTMNSLGPKHAREE